MKMKTIRFVYSFAKSYKKHFLIILSTIIITTYIVAMYPFLYGKMVDTLFYNGRISEFFVYIGIYFTIFLVNQFLHFVLDMVTVKTRMNFLADIKSYIFRKTLSYKGDKLSDIKSGDVIYRMNHDADEFMNLIYSDIFYGISALFDLILCIVMTMIINIPLAMISVLLAIITFVIGKYFSEIAKMARKSMVSHLSNNQAWLLEILRCLRDVRLVAATKNVINKYLIQDIISVRLGIKLARYEVLSDRCNAAMQVLCMVSLYGFSALFMVRGTMTLGGMIACIDYFERIVLMLTRISKRFLTIPNRTVAIERVMDVGTVESESDTICSRNSIIQHGEIDMKNIYFSYDGKHNILNNLSLKIAPGEKIAIVGKSGEGKSTLAYLLCRLYEADSGDIKIDGISIKDYDLGSLRKQIAIAFQDAILFENTIRYNLVFSEDTARDPEIWSILEKVKMDDFVRELPDGLDTKLMKTDRALSGGQKQRIEIARLLLKRAPIIIFDESTSHLDRETEQNILDSCKALLENRTVLMIAHRFETIMDADRIAYLEDGKVVAYDQHENLLLNCKPYAQLVRGQHATSIEKGNSDDKQCEK